MIHLAVEGDQDVEITPDDFEIGAGETKEVEITPTGVSQSADDVVIAAQVNGATIATQKMTVVKVTFGTSHIRAADTPGRVDDPKAPNFMPDRIAPGQSFSDRVTVTPNLAGSGQSVKLEISGQGRLNGAATIDGDNSIEVTSTAMHKIAGEAQTAANGGKNASELHLEAEVGSKVVSKSFGFSVAAIPDGWTESFAASVRNKPLEIMENEQNPPGTPFCGLITHVDPQSDSEDSSDLVGGITVIEAVQVKTSTGKLLGSLRVQSIPAPISGDNADFHVVNTTRVSGVGHLLYYQVHLFSDMRTGNGIKRYVIPNSGYRIEQSITNSDEKNAYVLTTTKSGAAVTVNITSPIIAKDGSVGVPFGKYTSAAGETFGIAGADTITNKVSIKKKR